MPIRCLSFTQARVVSAVDTLVAGDLLRIVLYGAPKLNARSPLEALKEGDVYIGDDGFACIIVDCGDHHLTMSLAPV